MGHSQAPICNSDCVNLFVGPLSPPSSVKLWAGAMASVPSMARARNARPRIGSRTRVVGTQGVLPSSSRAPQRRWCERGPTVWPTCRPRGVPTPGAAGLQSEHTVGGGVSVLSRGCEWIPGLRTAAGPARLRAAVKNSGVVSWSLSCGELHILTHFGRSRASVRAHGWGRSVSS